MSEQTSDLTGLAGWVADVIEALGAVGVAVLVALENIFPPLPSEVILPLAGFLGGQGRLPVGWVIVAATAGSLVGAWVLYALGATLGADRTRALLCRLPLVEGRDVDRAQAWFDRHGGTAVFAGRMAPVVRSFISIPAGVVRMPLWRFTVYTAAGSGLWNAAWVLAGYWLGSAWHDVGRYSSAISYAIVAALVGLVAWFVVRRLRKRARAASDPVGAGRR